MPYKRWRPGTVNRIKNKRGVIDEHRVGIVPAEDLSDYRDARGAYLLDVLRAIRATRTGHVTFAVYVITDSDPSTARWINMKGTRTTRELFITTAVAYQNAQDSRISDEQAIVDWASNTTPLAFPIQKVLAVGVVEVQGVGSTSYRTPSRRIFPKK